MKSARRQLELLLRSEIGARCRCTGAVAQSYEVEYLGTSCADFFDILHAVYGFNRGAFGEKIKSVATLVAEIRTRGV